MTSTPSPQPTSQSTIKTLHNPNRESRQRYTQRLASQPHRKLCQQIEQEKKSNSRQTTQNRNALTQSTELRYGLKLNTSFSPFRNAIHNRLHSHNTNPPNQPTNLAFHDLTPGAIAPPLTNSVLGLGSKFIVAPKSTTRDITTNISRLDRDFKLRVFFAGPKDPLDPFATCTSNFYVPSTWQPNWTDITYWVDA